MTRIIVDENVPGADALFGPLGEVRTISGREIDRSVAAGADVLIVRSITRINAALLDRTPVRFVGTATIGRDHIDDAFCAAAGIATGDAAGASTRSVAEYIIAVLCALRVKRGSSIGLVGVGSIGSDVAVLAKTLGFDVRLYDPPRAARDPEFTSITRNELADCNVISLSVPLIHDGPHPTTHLVDRSFLATLARDTLLINTSRGSVVKSTDLLSALESGRLRAVLDVWEGEPAVPTDLLAACSLVTPHVAGYARDAKLRGAAQVAKALAQFLGRPIPAQPDQTSAGTIDAGQLNEPVLGPIERAVNLRRDDTALRAAFARPETERSATFDRLRREHRHRREFGAWTIVGGSSEDRRTLRALGFTIADETGE